MHNYALSPKMTKMTKKRQKADCGVGGGGAYMYNVDIDDAIDHALQTVKAIIE